MRSTRASGRQRPSMAGRFPCMAAATAVAAVVAKAAALAKEWREAACSTRDKAKRRHRSTRCRPPWVGTWRDSFPSSESSRMDYQRSMSSRFPSRPRCHSSTARSWTSTAEDSAATAADAVSVPRAARYRAPDNPRWNRRRTRPSLVDTGESLGRCDACTRPRARWRSTVTTCTLQSAGRTFLGRMAAVVATMCSHCRDRTNDTRSDRRSTRCTNPRTRSRQSRRRREARACVLRTACTFCPPSQRRLQQPKLMPTARRSCGRDGVQGSGISVASVQLKLRHLA